MALYAPVTVMLVVVTWLVLVLLGYMLMYFASGVSPLSEAFRLSGSSLLTLGFAPSIQSGCTSWFLARRPLG